MMDYDSIDYAEAERHYATLSLKELRRYQEITQAQIRIAHSQNKTRALNHLQRTDALVTEAIYRKVFV